MFLRSSDRATCFREKSMKQEFKTSKELAELVDGTLVGPAGIRIVGVAGLAEATPRDASFLANDRYRARVLPSLAGVVLVPPGFEHPPPAGRAWIVCDSPSDAFSRLISDFAPPSVEYPPGCHPSAVVHASAQVAASAHVGACAVVEAGASVGESSVIGAGTYLGHDVRIGDGCLIYPNVTIRERCLIGDRVIIHSGATVGSDGFGFVPGPDGHEKIQQLGIVQIDSDVEIGAQTAIDRARFGKTWIQQGAKIDNLVQIAHNVVVGRHCFIVAQVGIAGSTRLGNAVIAAGQVGIIGHLEVGDGAVLMAQAGVSKDVPAGARYVGSPALPRREFVRTQAAFHGHAKMRASLKLLEERVAELEARLRAIGEPGDD